MVILGSVFRLKSVFEKVRCLTKLRKHFLKSLVMLENQS